MSVASTADIDRERSQAEMRFSFSLSVASTLVIVCVLIAWVLVKHAGNDENLAWDNALEALPSFGVERSDGALTALLEQADTAFAAGRIVEPRFDSALYFYNAALKQAPEAPEVLVGVERVMRWLDGQGGLALERGDFAQASALAAEAVELMPADASAVERLDRMTRIERYATGARREQAAGQLALAAQSWRSLLALDADNRIARAALRSTINALVDTGLSEVAAGRVEAARRLFAEVRTIDAQAEGLARLEAELDAAAAASAAQVAQDEAVEEIRSAIRDGLLLGDQDVDGFSLLSAYAQAEPTNPQLGALLAEALRALFELGRQAVAVADFERVARVLERAGARGASAQNLNDLRDLAHNRYLADFARGIWTVRPISELTALQQRPPVFPERALRSAEGYIGFEFTVARNGRVRDVRVVDTSSDALIQPGRETVESWRFEPGRLFGRTIPVRVAFRFRIRG